MKILLVAALASLMALPAMANRGKDKSPGKEKSRVETERAKETRDKTSGNNSQSHTESVTSNQNKVVEPLVKSFEAFKTKGVYTFKSAEEGLLPEGVKVVTDALKQRAVKEKLDASMVQSAETIIENFKSSLEIVNEKFPKEQAERINELADNILQATAKTVTQRSSEDVKADIALVMTMVAQAKMFESAKEAPESYMTMVNNLLSLRVEGALKEGAVRKQMGEDLYSEALRNCLNAA